MLFSNQHKGESTMSYLKQEFIKYLQEIKKNHSPGVYVSSLANIEKLLSVNIDAEYENDGCAALYDRLQQLRQTPEEIGKKEHDVRQYASNLKKYTEFKVWYQTETNNKESSVMKYLKAAKDIIPDEYDGSYELVREIVNSYSTLSDDVQLTSKDLDAVYAMAIGTWKMSMEKKKEYIQETHLSENEKVRLFNIIDIVWDKACLKQYEHNEVNGKPSVGMFGTGFYRFKVSDSDAHNFIRMLVKIREAKESDWFPTIHIPLEVFRNDITGMGASSASIILHCLQPTIFPIINGNMGLDNIYEHLGINLSSPKSLTTYSRNCISIKMFCEKNFRFKNFRVLDWAARLLSPNDDFWPSLDEYDPQISAEKWIELLNNESIFGPVYKGVLAAFYKYGPSSCSKLDSLFDNAKDGSFRSWVIQIAKKIHEETNCPLMTKEETSEMSYWPILFVGRNPKDDESGSWIYKLREELYEALTEVNILNHLWKVKLNYWLYEPGHKAMYWDEVYENGVIQLSGTELGDLSQYKDKAQIKSALEKSKTFTGSASNVSIQSYDFYHVMKPGDIIYIRVGSDDILGRGIVESEYYFDNESAFPHKRAVTWTHKGNWTLKRDTAIIKELTLIDKKLHKDYPIKLEELFKEETSMKENFSKNIILYGPPGTGKTYNTVNYAVAIIEGKSIEEIQNEDYDVVKKRYEKFLSDKQVQFTTFHQSYGYEDFIEGIKPVVDEEEDTISYKLVDGIFKKFCDDSRIKAEDTQKYDLNKNPKVWKVSLEGTRDNPTREECMTNGHIRIGWDDYGENLSDITDYYQGGEIVLNSFVSKMKVGDIVLSCYTASTIDAIGIVTGEPEWHPEYDKYRRLRKVKWIVKDIRENIVDINNGKTMTLSSVYSMNVKAADVLDIIDKYKPRKKNNQNKKYVFIIDEINRGNISKIFGELITLLEDSKREGNPEQMSAILPYSQEEFSVPNNVYVIGTMNTADRSIALMDTALRRRFNFIEMMPRADVLDGIEVDGVNIAQMLETINERIALLYDREHTIGHAFFIPLKKEPTIEKLAEIFENKLIPLLQEYFYEDYEKIQLVLGDNAKDKQFQFIAKETVQISNVFKGSASIDFELPTAKYTINKDALLNIDSYKKIM